ncbi:MAG: hypothetical protein ACOC4M_17100 [Promethearchaeia archaeon]
MNRPNILTKIGILRKKIENAMIFEALVTLRDIEKEVKKIIGGE